MDRASALLSWPALALTFALAPALSGAEVLRQVTTPTGSGSLERLADGFLVLRMEGSWYDMGFQHGTLLKDEAHAAREALISTIKSTTFVPFFLVKWHVRRTVANRQRPYIPEAFLQEMQGLSDAVGSSVDEIQLFHSFTYLSTNCTVAAAWGRATASGELIFVRSNDSFLTVDRERKRTIHPILFVYRPHGGVPFTMVSWPGYIGASDGMNGAGIAVANTTKRSTKKTPAGLPMIFRLKQVLARATTLEQARELIMARPFEGGYDFVLADAKRPSALVVEMDAESVYAGGWDGPAESSTFSYRGQRYSHQPTPDFLLRTNHPLSPELVTHFADVIDGPAALDCLSGPRYRLFKERFTSRPAELTSTRAMEILRQGYREMDQGPGDTCAPVVTHQAVFTPATGHVLLALSRGHAGGKTGPYEASAYNQPWRSIDVSAWLRRDPEPGPTPPAAKP
jgi:predicted choloylglycine hydrolase